MRTAKLLSVFLIILSSACGYGIEYSGCKLTGDEDLAIQRIVETWPENEEIIDRLDVKCVPRAETAQETETGCWREVDGCTPTTGGDMKRALVVSADGVSVANLLIHEAQHWPRKRDRSHDNWDWKLESRLKAGLR